MPKTKPCPYKPSRREIEAASEAWWGNSFHDCIRRALIAANKVREGMKNG